MSLISIIIPTYEQRGHGPMMLYRLLTSIKKQTFRHEFEVLITDNSKNNKILDMITTYFHYMEQIRYIKNTEYVGHVENFNFAMDNARGEFIKPMCMDDEFLLPNALEEFWATLHIASWVVSDSHHIDKHGHVKYKKKVRYDPNEFAKNITGMPSVVAWRKNHLRFDPALRTYCDLWFYRQLYDLYGEPVILRSFNIGQRFWNHSASRTLPSSHEKDRLIIKERLNL